MWCVLACYFLGPLFIDWAPGCYVRCGCNGSPVFSFPVDGRGVCPLVLCSLLLLSDFGSVASCLISFSVRRLTASSCSSEQPSVPV